MNKQTITPEQLTNYIIDKESLENEMISMLNRFMDRHGVVAYLMPYYVDGIIHPDRRKTVKIEIKTDLVDKLGI
jgi:hypothetical protein